MKRAKRAISRKRAKTIANATESAPTLLTPFELSMCVSTVMHALDGLTFEQRAQVLAHCCQLSGSPNKVTDVSSLIEELRDGILDD